MMKIVYFLSFLVFCQAISDQPPQNVTVAVHQADNMEIYFVASWEKVESSDDDPIVGYKLKLYQGKLYIHYEKNKDGSNVTEVVEPKSPEKPITEIAEFKVSADKTEYTYHNMTEGVLYEIAVQAYSAKNEGPLSKKKGFSFF